MFVLTLILFLLPSSLLLASWLGFRKAIKAPRWRAYLGVSAITLAICSTILELLFFYSWFHNGGSPHGMMPSPGIWRYVGRIAFYALIASVVFSLPAKGKWKLFIPAWAASFLLIAYMIFMLEMD